LNRAGACDIASIHTALYDWRLAHEQNGEVYDAAIARLAGDCLNELDQNADEVYNVTPRGIDTIVDLYRREVKFCTEFGSSRPEEGAEHIVAYSIEHLTRRHFVHGDLVGFGIHAMSLLQNNRPAWATSLIRRCGLRHDVPDASREELRQALASLKEFKADAALFYSVVDSAEITTDFIDAVMAAL
jgi:glycerol-1-phosphate dehydrogenase [NAD(P)+]